VDASLGNLHLARARARRAKHSGGRNSQVKILTGDNELVTRHVCEQVGLESNRIVLGSELDHMSDAALTQVVEQVHVFARVSPAQKNRIILALKKRKHVVGYMGDGINDAPSFSLLPLPGRDDGHLFAAGSTGQAALDETIRIVTLQRNLWTLVARPNQAATATFSSAGSVRVA
jgi:haloacid dehalogenase-like hydrolase